jgi:hypothetical protein
LNSFVFIVFSGIPAGGGWGGGRLPASSIHSTSHLFLILPACGGLHIGSKAQLPPSPAPHPPRPSKKEIFPTLRDMQKCTPQVLFAFIVTPFLHSFYPFNLYLPVIFPLSSLIFRVFALLVLLLMFLPPRGVVGGGGWDAYFPICTPLPVYTSSWRRY